MHPNILGDHLHIRGEYYKQQALLEYEQGSPPHTWRILLLLAGYGGVIQDHLHIRGEYTKRSLI